MLLRLILGLGGANEAGAVTVPTDWALNGDWATNGDWDGVS